MSHEAIYQDSALVRCLPLLFRADVQRQSKHAAWQRVQRMRAEVDHMRLSILESMVMQF